MSRAEIINKIIEEQNKIIDNLQNSADEYRNGADLDETDTSDPDDLSRQTESKDMQLRVENLLAKEKNDLDFLLSEKGESHTEAELGALIETDENYFFMSVAIPAFTFKGKEVYCVSPEAPLFAELKDKKVGDTFKLGDKTQTIKKIS